VSSEVGGVDYIACDLKSVDVVDETNCGGHKQGENGVSSTSSITFFSGNVWDFINPGKHWSVT